MLFDGVMGCVLVYRARNPGFDIWYRLTFEIFNPKERKKKKTQLFTAH